MFIYGTQYQSDIVFINDIREALFATVYRDANGIASLRDIITRYIECNNIEFSYADCAFMIKIKKTAMRRMKEFYHTPNFYYRLISKIFYDLITSNEYIILDALRKVGYINPDPKLLLDDALKNPKNLANLCNVTCISDNILIIKL